MNHLAFLDTLLSPLSALVTAAVVAFFKSFKFIKEGERGLKLRFGKVVRDREKKPVIYEPGFLLMIPFIESLPRHHVRQQTARLHNQKVTLKDGLIYDVSAIVIFRVSDIYKALCEIDDLDGSLADVSVGVLRDELSSRTHDNLSNTVEISAGLLKRLKDRAGSWGIELLEFMLVDCAPTPEVASLVNCETGARLRIQALKRVAQEIGGHIADVPESLAAVLVGAPLVASIGGEARKGTASNGESGQTRNRKTFWQKFADGSDKSGLDNAEDAVS